MDLGSLNLENIENIINSMSQKDIEDLSSIASQFFSAGTDSTQKQKQEENRMFLLRKELKCFWKLR